jgi:predicted adenylyl cyclase CyaB
MKNIEVELRSLIDECKFIKLNRYLRNHGKYLGEDNKDTFFFLFSDKLLKVTNNFSKHSAKITLKLNKIGRGSDFKEIEIPISQDDVGKTIEAFKHLGFRDNQYSYQYRHNYIYKGIEIAVKYTQSWGFHVELELLVDEDEDKEEVKRKILAVAESIGLQIMSDKELKDFTSKIDKGWNRGEYTKDTFNIKI